MASAIIASGLLNPNAMRVSRHILVLVESTGALDSRCSKRRGGGARSGRSPLSGARGWRSSVGCGRLVVDGFSRGVRDGTGGSGRVVRTARHFPGGRAMAEEGTLIDGSGCSPVSRCRGQRLRASPDQPAARAGWVMARRDLGTNPRRSLTPICAAAVTPPSMSAHAAHANAASQRGSEQRRAQWAHARDCFDARSSRPMSPG